MKRITHKIDSYIDGRNRTLWRELSSEYDIELFYDKNGHSWRVEIHSKKVKIICNEIDINIPSFTHELLHVKLEKLGMTTHEELQDYTSNHQIFNNFVFSTFIHKVSNFHSHKKMYPYFNKMGFNDEDFVTKRAKLSFMDKMQLRILPRIKYLRLFGIEGFLGIFFALKNDVVKSDKENINKKLKILKSIDKELYEIADEFDNEWDNRKDFDYLQSVEIFSNKLSPYMIKKYSKKK